MSTTELEFDAVSRNVSGKGAMRRLRAEGKIPGIVYGDGNAATQIELDYHSFDMMLQRHSGANILLNLKLDGGEPVLALLKEVQRHPMANTIRHVDFQQVTLDRRVVVKLALDFVGTPKGVENGGGTLDRKLRTLNVECKAGEMLESFDVDISHLGVGEHLYVKDVVLPEGFKMKTAANVSMVSVLKARVKVADADDEA